MRLRNILDVSFGFKVIASLGLYRWNTRAIYYVLVTLRQQIRFVFYNTTTKVLKHARPNHTHKLQLKSLK